MGLDIWFAEDICNALLAANEASAATAAVIAEMGAGPSASPSTGSGQDSGRGPSTLRQDFGETSPSSVEALSRAAQGSGQAVTDSTELLVMSLRAYREGYKAALTTVALAFGLAPQAITLQPLREPEISTYHLKREGTEGRAPTSNPSAPSDPWIKTCHQEWEGAEGKERLSPQPLQPPSSGEEP